MYSCIIHSTDLTTNVQLRFSTPHILSHMYSVDYRLHIFNHICTAYIIDSTDFITYVQLILSTPQILSHMYSLYYLLRRFYHICTAYIIDSTDFITHVQLGLSTPQMLSQYTAWFIYSTYFSKMYSLDFLPNRLYHICTA
jgi:hypothetical protein